MINPPFLYVMKEKMVQKCAARDRRRMKRRQFGSFGEFLKSRLELFQDSGSDNVDFLIIRHIKIRRRLDIDQ